MARYTDDSRERVRDAIDFVEVVGARTELRKAGVRRYVGLCPFHDEKSPSFGIDPVEKLYHCFGCGVGGDAFKFVMETEGVGFGEALELLADRANVTLERTEEDPRASERRDRRDRLHALLERTTAYYVRRLWESPDAEPARAYLRERGLQEPALREFRVGYAPDAWDRVIAGSTRAGYAVDELLAAGLAQRSRGGSGLIDRFRGRLMFPWADARGRVLGFGARALAADDLPKYLNSAEGEVFHKGRQVYGADLARAGAARAGAIVLVEGYTDVIALHQAGLRHAVGSMGTAVTVEQAGELAKLAPTVLLCLDADAAGRTAMRKAADALGRVDRRLELRVVALPTGSDPADVVGRDGAAAMAALLDAAVPFARWQVDQALAEGNLDSAEGRDRVLSEAGAVLRELPASVLREELVRLVAGRLGLSEGLAASALSGGGRRVSGTGGRGDGSGGADGEAGRSARRALDRREEAEHAFLAMCVALPALGARRLAGPEVSGLLSSELTRRAAGHLRAHADAPSAGLPPDDDALAGLVAELVVRAGGLTNPEPSDLDRAALMLDLARLDRGIATARASQTPVSDLAAERQRVLGELRRLTR